MKAEDVGCFFANATESLKQRLTQARGIYQKVRDFNKHFFYVNLSTKILIQQNTLPK